MKSAVLGKAVALAVIVLVLLWFLVQVQNIVAERTDRQREAQRSVADSLASAQTLLAPMLLRECTERWEVEQGEGKERRRVTQERTFTLQALPDTLDITARATTDLRYRGIFEVKAFVLGATVEAQWASLAALQPQPLHAGGRVTCALPTMRLAVSDARGIRALAVTLQGRTLPVVAGPALAGGGHTLEAAWPAAVSLDDGVVTAKATLELAGTESLAFVPAARATQVKLASDWPHPSFGGSFLPIERTIGDDGFSATWRVTALASRASQQVLGAQPLCRPRAAADPRAAMGQEASARASCIESFDVAFVDPVSAYALADRATKYGLLFIGLTFLGVALIEVTRRLRVHPVQYLLVGLALTMFFLLLVSLGEHVTFAWAYLVAGTACTALLALYGKVVLGGTRRALWFGVALALLYVALYVLLLREQTALVLGSGLLFAVLAAVMLVTRHIDWYQLFGQLGQGSAGVGTPSVEKRNNA
ncbi:MAG: cell envelope integrity protein CreD [Burkholderiales bacterium]|nr:cell envelope integrity protein CreD [Burkholderiales bacterium]